ncbi:MAG TPA: sialate O-acetylesterase [Pyrinomonadaceae bacterium]|nr:sialate O-acetylesterase [Pyrinomonadaceae bacterium]
MKVLLLIVLLLAATFVHAEVQIPDVIASSMVLQQKQTVPIWGTAEPGEAVTVTFGKIRKTVVADANGKWRVDLGKLSAKSTPQTMTIAGKNTIVLNDILVGEVWLVAGQSNMQRLLRETDNGDAVQASANHPNIRLFNVSREVAFKKRTGKLGEWLACTPESVKEFSAAGYYFGGELEKELKVPIGLINSSFGGSQAEAWTPVEYLSGNPDLKATVERTKVWDAERPRVRVEYDEAIKKWRETSDKQKASGVRPSPSPAVPDALREYRIASSIYDGMIAPLIPFAIKGAIWYQGESNEARAEQYNILLPTMIRSWRERWGEGNFPFGIIQLPNYRAVKNDPEESAWSFLRDAQRRTALTTPNTGLIVTIDIGEPNDIHPKNKLDVGLRMFRWALRDAYGRSLSDSPVLKKSEVKGGKMLLTFENAGAGLKLTNGDALNEFAIAGADKKWVWAEAKIVGKNNVEVWSPSISVPVAVRYAFNSNPKRPNLTNDSGVPAGPFRTDAWPDPTAGKR